MGLLLEWHDAAADWTEVLYRTDDPRNSLNEYRAFAPRGRGPTTFYLFHLSDEGDMLGSYQKDEVSTVEDLLFWAESIIYTDFERIRMAAE